MLGSLLRSVHVARQDVAERLGISVQTIHNWVHDRTSIPPRQLQRLVDILSEAQADPELVRRFIADALRLQGLDIEQTFDRIGGGQPAEEAGPSSPPIVIAAWRAAGGSMPSLAAQACRQTLERLGYRCLLLDCGGNRGRAREAVAAIAHWGAKGAILFLPGTLPEPRAEQEEFARTLVANGTAVVFGQFWFGGPDLPDSVGVVQWDRSAIAAMGVETIWEAGHRTVSGLFLSDPSIPSTLGPAFMRAASDRGLTVTFADWNSQQPADLASFREAMTSAGAVFVDSPIGLPLVAHAAHELGLEWPRDVSVLGVAGPEPPLQLGNAPFSMIHVPVDRVGQSAAQVLLRLWNDPACPTDERYVVFGRDSLSLANIAGGSLGPPPAD